MEIVKVPLEQINPAAYNPRVDLQPGDSEYEKLKRSIEEFGYIEPIVWNRHTGNIVGGHQRFKILQARGDVEFEVSAVDLDQTAEKALNLALNKIAGRWDDEKLAVLLEELRAESLDLALTGFDESEVDKLLSKFEEDGDSLDGESFRYQEQFGVIVTCSDAAHQEEVYNRLTELGYSCKVVCV